MVYAANEFSELLKADSEHAVNSLLSYKVIWCVQESYLHTYKHRHYSYISCSHNMAC